MNRKAMQLAISTIILMTIGLFVLIGLTYALTDGFKSFKRITDPFIESEAAKAAIQVCNDACSNEARLIYCCQEFDISDEMITCTDSRLEISCGLDCEGFSCEG